ncbi:hypothetical protein [Nocardiopsis prasina]|uniref:hypothetical protein n=1 Tax=Nocardiopsis prasina TaxID=2015 RepID=UPI0003474011
MIFERLPARMVGRGMSMVGALARIGAPVAAPGVGVAIGLFGVSPVLAAGAALYLAAVCLPAFGRAARGLERPPEPPEAVQRPDQLA